MSRLPFQRLHSSCVKPSVEVYFKLQFYPDFDSFRKAQHICSFFTLSAITAELPAGFCPLLTSYLPPSITVDGSVHILTQRWMEWFSRILRGLSRPRVIKRWRRRSLAFGPLQLSLDVLTLPLLFLAGAAVCWRAAGGWLIARGARWRCRASLSVKCLQLTSG